MNSGISLSMIVRNEGKHLYECLNSVKNVVDEIVIVDTGSTDNTVEIAKSFNAKIFYFEWNDDFSAARNFALKKCTGDWILYLDADERLDENSAKKIKSLTQTQQNVGYYCTIKNYDSEIQRNHTIRYIRFFRNSPEAKFTGKVHEQITPSLEKLNYKFIHSDLLIHHIGYDISKEGKKQKAIRNLKLLLEDYNISENDYVLFQIGQSYFVLENFSDAKNTFLKLIEFKKPSKQLKAESFSYLAQISFNEFRNSEAEKFINDAIKLNDAQPFYHLLLSKIHLRFNRIKEAKDELSKSIKLQKDSLKTNAFNLQQVNLSNEELLYYGLQLAFKSGDLNLKNKMLEELSKTNEIKFVEFLKKVETQSFDLISDLTDYLNSVTQFNISLLTHIISNYNNKVFAMNALSQLYQKFSNNPDVIKQYALTLDNVNKTPDALKLFENNFDSIKSDPSSLLYLVMFYLKTAQNEKALEILNTIENNFAQFEEVVIKVRAFKEKFFRNVRLDKSEEPAY
ncbi:MAG: glycosyltransferase [Ignavibacterium sp.]